MNKEYLEYRYIYNRRLNAIEELIMTKIKYGEPCIDLIDYIEILKSRLKDNEQNK